MKYKKKIEDMKNNVLCLNKIHSGVSFKTIKNYGYKCCIVRAEIIFRTTLKIYTERKNIRNIIKYANELNGLRRRRSTKIWDYSRHIETIKEIADA